MPGFAGVFSIKTIALFWGFIVLSSFSNPSVAIDIDQASQQVKSQFCKDDLTIDQALDKSIKSHSQRDIGWRSFQEGEFYDIERAVLINKGMELRYRWRVAADGRIQPQNERTEKLCRLDAD